MSRTVRSMRRLLVTASVLLALAGSLRGAPRRATAACRSGWPTRAAAYAADHRRGRRHRLHDGHGHLVGPARARLGARPGSAPGPFRGERPGRGRHPDPGHEHHAHRSVRPAVRLRYRAAPAGTRYPYRRVGDDARGGARTTRPAPTTAGWSRCPRTAAAGEAEHLVGYRTSTPVRWSSASTTTGRYGAGAPGSSSTSTGRVRPPAACPCRRPPWTGSWPGPTRPAGRTSRSGLRPDATAITRY